MTTVAIELNDAEIRLAGPGRTLAIEPGYAWLDGDQIRVGADAFRASSLEPRRVHNRFWAELDQAPIERPGTRTVTHADLAYEQLSQLWTSMAEAASDALFVVPGSMRREQLALLLGIADSCRIPVRGLLDSAVASCSRSFPGAQLLHWDVGLHSACITALDQSDGVEQREVEALPQLGLASLREAQVASIARAFVEQARFDPLHDAGGEQALHDRLPEFVAALHDHASARIELQVSSTKRVAEIRRADLARPVAELAYAMREQSLQMAEGPVVALVSHRLADLPGFAEATDGAARLELVPLEPDAACRGALARLDQVPRGKTGHTRVRRLAWDRPEPVAAEAVADGGARGA